MLNLCGIVADILKMATGRIFRSQEPFRHNTANIQHCPISSKFDMWVDNDVPILIPNIENFYISNFDDIGQC
jgi:hypothetical protein